MAKTEDKEELSIDLAGIRRELGFSKYQFAKVIGVSWNTYHLWERGVYKPRVPHMEKILEVVEEFQKK